MATWELTLIDAMAGRLEIGTWDYLLSSSPTEGMLLVDETLGDCRITSVASVNTQERMATVEVEYE